MILPRILAESCVGAVADECVEGAAAFWLSEKQCCEVLGTLLFGSILGKEKLLDQKLPIFVVRDIGRPHFIQTPPPIHKVVLGLYLGTSCNLLQQIGKGRFGLIRSGICVAHKRLARASDTRRRQVIGSLHLCLQLMHGA